MPLLTLRDIPNELLSDVSLPVVARFIYVQIWNSSGRSIKSLCDITGCAHHSVRSHCAQLQKAGWLAIERTKSGYVVFPSIPHKVQQRMAEEFEEHLELCAHAGEATTRAWRDVLVADSSFLDNFRPAFLRNPKTGQAMEYDMFDPLRSLGVEYHGPQHFKPTLLFPNLAMFEEQRTRDLLKQGLSVEHGIRLITVQATDLSLKGMLAKFEGLPLKRYDPSGPLVTTLEKVGAKLILAAKKLEQRLAATALGQGPDQR